MSSDFKVGEWLVESSRYRLVREGSIRKIEARHMRVLVYLARHAGKQVASAALLHEAYRNKKASESSLAVVIHDLREALEDREEPAAYIRTVPDKGYMLVAPVTMMAESNSGRAINRTFLVTATLVAVLVFVLQLQLRKSEPPPTEAPIDTLALVPFENTAGTSQGARLALGMALLLKNRLRPLQSLTVVAVPAQHEGPLPPELQLDAKIQGGVAIHGSHVVFSASLIGLNPERTLWEKKVDGPIEQSLSLQRQLFRELIHALKPAQPATGAVEGKIAPDAYLALLEGYVLLAEGQFGEALSFFDKARTQAPDHAEPYVGLALGGLKLYQPDSERLLKEIPAIEALLQRAISLNPNLAEAHLAMAMLHFQYSWSFAKAEDHFKKALDLAPNQVDVHIGYAMFCLAFSRFETATEHLKIARKLDPFNQSVDVAWMYAILGDNKTASAHLEAIAKQDQRSPALHGTLLKLFEYLNQETDAYRHYRQMFLIRGYTPEALSMADTAFQKGGIAGLSRWLLSQNENRDVGQYAPPLAYARYLAAAHDKDLAFEWLQKAFSIRQPELVWLNVDPKYDVLRGDPRFQTLLKQVGLDYRPQLVAAP